jgi:hypothetical protein
MSKIILISVVAGFVLCAAQALAKPSEFQSLYADGVSHVYVSNTKAPSKSELNNFGHSICDQKSFCLIWYFDDETKAKYGVNQMKSGNTWDPIPGLIGIYSKNKKANSVICYEPSSSC